MSKRGGSAVIAPAAPAEKKSRGANGQANAAAADSSASAAAAHSGKTTHDYHGPLPLTAPDSHSLRYLPGFAAELQSEALPHALPVGQNSPQVCPYGLFAEQLSGSSFTTPRKDNQRSWLYRIRPTVGHPPFTACDVESGGESAASPLVVGDFSGSHVSPNQYRWRPFSTDTLSSHPKAITFVQGLATLAGHGSPDSKSGLAIHIYTCNASMVDTAFTNSDGDMLIVPQQGTLHIRTEMGMLRVAPGHIAVVQRGIAFSVGVDEAAEQQCRGYICEIYNGHFKLPDLGPIGANGLANPRDFLHPTAQFEDREVKFTVVQKFIGKFFQYQRTHSPFDVVAWHGNYAPYMYDLARFCPVGAVLFDHIDPSVFTVLTAATAEPGVAACDFVIFPPRWAVQEHTFRPPYYHRNCMSEFMGCIRGQYEAKVVTGTPGKPEGFLPGGASLHSCMASHGPDAASFAKASTEELRPMRLPDNALAFMFESTYMLRLTDWALKVAQPDAAYWKVWEPIQSNFDPHWKKPDGTHTQPTPAAAVAAVAAAQHKDAQPKDTK